MSTSKAMVQKAIDEFRTRADEQVVLVLQSGGALGVHQVGVHEAGVEPDWIMGTSIGAINASVIAGNNPQGVTQMHVVCLLAPRLENENHTKDIDFTPSGIRMRREAGYDATMRALGQAPWQGRFDAIEGIILHESMPDLAMAAE